MDKYSVSIPEQETLPVFPSVLLVSFLLAGSVLLPNWSLPPASAVTERKIVAVAHHTTLSEIQQIKKKGSCPLPDKEHFSRFVGQSHAYTQPTILCFRVQIYGAACSQCFVCSQSIQLNEIIDSKQGRRVAIQTLFVFL